MRFSLIPLIAAGAFGCSAPVVLPPPTDLEPYSSGATVYIVDANEDWLDDCSVEITNRYEDRNDILWMGKQALKIALRSIAQGNSAHLVHTEHCDLREGDPIHVTLPVPEAVHYFAPVGEGKYELRESRQPGSLDLTATPTMLGEDKHLVLNYSLERVHPVLSKIKGTELNAGDPVFNTAWTAGNRGLPLGATLLIPFSRGNGRCTVILIHIASVTRKSS
jgi:hypothetical protein